MWLSSVVETAQKTHTPKLFILFVYVHMWLHRCVYMCVGQRSMSSAFIIHAPSFFGLVCYFVLFFWDGLSLNLEFTSLANLADQRAPSCCLLSTSFPLHTLLPPLYRDCRQAMPYMAFLHRFWGLNLGPQACMAGTLLTEPSPPAYALFILLFTFNPSHFFYSLASKCI